MEEVRGEALHSPRLAMEVVREFVVVHLGHLTEEAVRLGVQGSAHLMQQEDGKVAELPCGVVVALLRHLGAGEVAAIKAVDSSRRVFNLGAAVD